MDNLWRASALSYDFNDAISEYCKRVAEGDTAVSTILGKQIMKMIDRRIYIEQKDATND